MPVPAEARSPTEGGLLDHRCVFAREDPTNRGEPPSDPAFKLYSDNMTSIWNWEPDGGLEAKRGVGSADAESFWPGPEEHEAEMTYHLQRWFVDAGGNPLDAAYDGLVRDSDNRLPNTHTVVDREKHNTGGSMNGGFHSYTVGLGGKIGTVSVEGEADESLPMEFSLEYQFEKVRPYIINQPTQSTTLTVQSDNAADTAAITIENEGATQTETVTLNGTTPVATTTAFSSVDAAWLSQETQGNVTISRNGAANPSLDPPNPQELVMPIYGKATHNNIEGDRGVPVLGAGSIESEIQPATNRVYEHFLSSTLSRAPTANIHGVEFGPRLSSSSFEVENNLDGSALAHSRRMALDEGVREVTVEASISGPEASHRTIMDHLINDGGTITWEFLGGTLQFPQAVVTGPGERVYEAEEVVTEVDVEFESRQTATEPAIVIQ